MPWDALTWPLALVVAAAIVLPYLLSFRRRRLVGRVRLEEAARLGTDRPLAQYPFIDATRCIGCGSCVPACPEGDVLAVVGGTARVVNALRCIGHGRCAIACPVGAIEIGLGDVREREDIPLVDAWQESSVAGLFVVGELSGMALVSNAVAQAVRAVERIAERAASPRGVAGPDVFDVAVVGAGPAGLAAAAAAGEKGLSHVVLEQESDLGGTINHYPRRKLVLVQPVEVPVLGRLREAEYTKEDLLGLLQRLVKDAPLAVRFGERVEDVRRSGELFEVRSAAGTVRSRFLVLALGRRGTPRKLGVPGEQLPKVMYRLLDAESYQHQRLLIVGGGDSAVEAAIGLARQRGNEVTLSYRREKLVRIKRKNEDRLARLLENGRVRGLMSSTVAQITPTSAVLEAGGGRQELANDYVFVFAGGEPPLALLHKAGIRFGGALSAARQSPS
ncbi:MAG TPA: NAD(P)-binding domain-containing protein [Vicinamibacteria bacterium]|nr:NAD(P)-binding domain-containing protein [Vicinamibacteria bacterium]